MSLNGIEFENWLHPKVKIRLTNQSYNCIKCGTTISDKYNNIYYCENCDKEMALSQSNINQYITDLIKWFRSVGWSYEQCKQALEAGLKMLK